MFNGNARTWCELSISVKYSLDCLTPEDLWPESFDIGPPRVKWTLFKLTNT